MGKNERIEALLIHWSQWLQIGDGSGYSTMSVLHPDWMPPSPGVTPTMKTSGASVGRDVHRAITTVLSGREQQTAFVHYVQRLSLEEQAERLECAPSTVTSRVARIHLLLAEALPKK